MNHDATPLIDRLPPGLHRMWGFWAIALGALGVLLVFARIAWPLPDDTPTLAQQAGEMAGEIRRAAWRSFLGLETTPPPPEPPTLRDRFMELSIIAAPILGVAAVILAAVSAVRREDWHLTVYGGSLGLAAIVFQFLWILAVLILCVLLIVKVIENMGDIFSF